MKKLVFAIIASFFLAAGCSSGPLDPADAAPSLELGIYTASTRDGQLFLELVDESACRLYFDRCPASTGTYKIYDGKIEPWVFTYVPGYFSGGGTSKMYVFSRSTVGTITGPASFKIDADTTEGRVTCDFRRLK